MRWLHSGRLRTPTIRRTLDEGTNGNPQRHLIVNADDFGQSAGVNRGVSAAHERGIVTSASLMVRWPTAPDAASYARTHPRLSVGLHLDLCEWTRRDGRWVAVYEVVPLDTRDVVATEAQRQLAVFRRLVGHDPTHLDSHQHVHRSEPVHSVLEEMAKELAVPLRDYNGEVRYCGAFYGQSGSGEPLLDAIRPAGLIRTLMALPVGVTELGCHPAEGDDLESLYRSERGLEVDALCDPGVKATIVAERIHLCSFDSRDSRPCEAPAGKERWQARF